MKAAVSALVFLGILVTTATPAAAQQSTSARRPPAYLTGLLSLDPVGEAVLAARGSVEVPLGRVARPWVTAGAWTVAGIGHTLVVIPGMPPRPPDPSGALVEVGLDAVPLRASSLLLPFVGAGAGLRTDHGERMLWPLARAGLDLQISRWFGPRVQAEWTRYPREGNVVLLTGGLRIGLPLP